MIYKCPNCGSALKYNPVTAQMECEYCVSFFNPEDPRIDVEGEKELLKETAASSEAAVLTSDDDEYMECNLYTCTSCGGELLVNGLESSTFCAYCGQPTIVFNRVSKELKPKYIVPFAVPKDEAVRVIREKLNAGFFVPDEIKSFETERIRGIYIPYWLCDLEYSDKQSLRGTVGSGKNKRTRYYYRAARSVFNNLTLDASFRLNDETSQRLEPFDMSYLEPFNPRYLSGYYADRYDVDQKAIRDVAFMRAKRMFDEEVRKTVKADDIKILENKPKMNVREMKYVLLPAWFLTFQYNGEAYTFLVNGQTKKVVGAVPYLRGIAFLMVAIISMILTAVGTPVMYMLLRSDIDDIGEVIAMAIAAGVFAYIGGFKNFKKVKKGINLTKSKVMMNFVKERQEGE